MATSESDSDVDFESADEGENEEKNSNAVSNETNKCSAALGSETVVKDCLQNETEQNKKVSELSNTKSVDERLNKSDELTSRLTETSVSETKHSNVPVTAQDQNVETESAFDISETDKLTSESAKTLENEAKSSNVPEDKQDQHVTSEPVISTVKEKESHHDAVSEESEKTSTSQSEDVLTDTSNIFEKETIFDELLPSENEAQSTEDVTNVTKNESSSRLSDDKVDTGSKIVENQPGWTPQIKDKDTVKRTVSDSAADTGNRVLLFKERKILEKASKASSLNEKDVLDRLSEGTAKEEKKVSPGWGLGNWSSSFISNAASSVSSFTSQVSQGFGTVLETVEASLGVPAPEDLVTNKNFHSDQQSDEKNTNSHESSGVLGNQDSVEKGAGDPETQKGTVGSLFGGVTAFTRVFESTSNKVITGGLDTLELIGRKTMDILSEGDPGLRKKRSLFSGGGSTLSQVLREARVKAEENLADLDDQKLVHYSKLFDEFQGLVHLEALEMLSDRCKSHVQKESAESEDENFVAVLEQLKEICEDLPATDDTPDDEVMQDFEKLLDEHCRALPFKTKVEKIKSVQCSATAWLINCKEDQDKGEVKDPSDVYKKAISSLAELTAAIMEHYHKIAEMALVTSIPGVSVEECAKNLTGLTTVFCTEVVIMSSGFCQCLSTAADDSEDPDAVNPLITNVYLECSNSNAYIQDAFQLLIPVLQDLALRHS